ncbi:MAG: LysR family transcriptional regulator [Polyangiaceae bacterium]|nr:LysR family transcriptional regulator [Polyangiaceae bacterium]
MLDKLTLDQLRAFVTVVDEGSFSAAGRKLKRVQSAVSTAMSNLELQLGVPLWDRSTKIATLTDEGKAVLGAARRVLAEVDSLRRLTTGLVTGLEPFVSLCVDALFPVPALVDLCTGFAEAFPGVDLRVDTQVMSAVSAKVVAGTATMGVVTPLGVTQELERRPLSPIWMLPVVGPKHPLARQKGPISMKHFAGAIQIVLSEGVDVGVADQAVVSTRTWRVGDLHTKHMMLRAGLGWGNLPEHLVRDDLRAKRLVAIRPEAWAEDEHRLTLSIVFRSDTVMGPAHRWVASQLEVLCARETGRAGVRIARAARQRPSTRKVDR